MHGDGFFFYEDDDYQLSMSFQPRGGERNEDGNGNGTQKKNLSKNGRDQISHIVILDSSSLILFEFKL